MSKFLLLSICAWIFLLQGVLIITVYHASKNWYKNEKFSLKVNQKSIERRNKKYPRAVTPWD